MKTVFLRALDADDKGIALLEAIREPDLARGKQRFEVEPRSFANVPRSPFAYWVSEQLRGAFLVLRPFGSDGREAWAGLQTNDDFRWVRLWSEPFSSHLGNGRSALQSPSWVPYAKGGEYSRYYTSLNLVIEWGMNGRAIKEWKREELRLRRITANNSQCWNETKYFQRGLTWSQRSQLGLSVRALSTGAIFGIKGPGAFCGDERQTLALLSVFNSSSFKTLVSMQMAFGSYDTGVIRRTPLPILDQDDLEELARAASRAWLLKRLLDGRAEHSRAYTLPALLQVEGTELEHRAANWATKVRFIEVELAGIQAKIDERCFALYGINEADRRAITEGFGGSAIEAVPSDGTDGVEEDVGDECEEDDSTADESSLAAELVSWAVGVAFGRFDVSLATGARPMPVEPEPFDPLSVCSPGMLTGGYGLPLLQPPPGYPLAFPEAGVLVDDPGHAQDLQTAVRSVFDVVFGAGADRWWNDVAALLDPKSNDLRIWLGGSFFEYHLKRYSKSRRKAPILWELGTPSGRYAVWLYAHRLTRDSFFQIQNDVVGPKLAHEERQLTNCVQSAGASPSSRDRKEIAKRTAFVGELRAMLDEVKRVTPLWNPTLDDGVVLVMAPLWRLVPQHKPWHKELKSKWDELVGAKYEWAHTAMHLWPERVVPKCATDRSLAIAHGLEDVFWAEADGKWKSRSIPTRPIDDLVRERSSPAVKAALKSLLDAPMAAAGGGRGRRVG